MAQVNRPRSRKVSDLKSSILDTALTTHYECSFNPPTSIVNLIPQSNVDDDYMLSCVQASLPGTSLATVELQNDHSGITERHAYRRQYDTTSSFTFLVKSDYKQIQFFETWIGYIVNEQNSQSDNYFYRVNYPKDYQTSICITNFERNWLPLNQKDQVQNDARQLTYVFLNAYPLSIDAMQVSYEGTQALRCTVNFNFSRYISGATRKTNLKYPVTGENDSSQWVGGQGFDTTGVVATTNTGAQAGETFANSGIVLENQYNADEL